MGRRLPAAGTMLGLHIPFFTRAPQKTPLPPFRARPRSAPASPRAPRHPGCRQLNLRTHKTAAGGRRARSGRDGRSSGPGGAPGSAGVSGAARGWRSYRSAAPDALPARRGGKYDDLLCTPMDTSAEGEAFERVSVPYEDKVRPGQRGSRAAAGLSSAAACRARCAALRRARRRSLVHPGPPPTTHAPGCALPAARAAHVPAAVRAALLLPPRDARGGGAAAGAGQVAGRAGCGG
jgi:hypothetical protein